MNFWKIRMANILFLTIFAIIFFILWIWVQSQTGYLKDVIYSRIFHFVPTQNEQKTPKVGSGEIDLDYFWEAFSLIKENYLSFESITNKEINEGMIKGLIESLKDKHSTYFNQEETKKFNDLLSGDFEGIGAVVTKNDIGVQVEQVVAGSPAKEAGILVGDILIKANETDLKNLSVVDAVGKIKGPAGTKVVLEILRSGEIQKLTKEIIRKKITIPSVDGKVLSGSIGYIQISIFGEKTGKEFISLYKSLRDQKIEGLVLDLRDNAGGYLNTAIEILSEFFEKNTTLVTTKEKNPLNNQSYFSLWTKETEMPVVLLINENSASASEITAGAFKDYKKWILVGEKTYGKGSVQQPFGLSDGGELKITVARWYTPNGNQIDEKGIMPDMEIILQKEDYEKRYDRQFEFAKEVAKEYIKSQNYTKTVDKFRQEMNQSGSTTNTGIINQ